MSLVKIDGRALEKFLYVVKSGVGAVFGPWLMRRRAQAEVDVRKIDQLGDVELAKMMIQDESELATLKTKQPTAANSEDIEIDVTFAESDDPTPSLTRRAENRFIYQETKRQANIVAHHGPRIQCAHRRGLR